MKAPAPRHTLGPQDVELLQRDTAFQGFFRVDVLTLRHRRFDGGWLGPMTRELFMRQPAVGVLAWDPHTDEVLLVEQFRVGALAGRGTPWCLEIIAGIVDRDDETLEQVARRETAEEAGLVLDQLLPLPSYLPSPGGSDERLHLFLAPVSLAGAGGVFGVANEHEDIRAVKMPLAEAAARLDAGEIDNAASMIALLWLQLHHVALRARFCGSSA
ncbi:NUDIX domain-containing protein [Isoalcanivorax beigongshangi]|uniref:ADP-ribose pyrophosphatase n=1 Tax=Isoalcanivorax beigongshangi TaxID=3238810 RepID=A0ABV4AGK7_9GAMM